MSGRQWQNTDLQRGNAAAVQEAAALATHVSREAQSEIYMYGCRENKLRDALLTPK